MTKLKKSYWFRSLGTLIVLSILTFTLSVSLGQRVSQQPLRTFWSEEALSQPIEKVAESLEPDDAQLIEQKKEELESLGLLNNTSGILGNITYGAITLDGRILFQVASAVTIDRDKPDSVKLIKIRVQEIENTLRGIVSRNLAPNQLKVAPAILNKQKVILVSRTDKTQEWVLMTITQLDADLYGVPIDRLAEIRSQVVAEALATAWQERQPEFLWRQSAIALGIFAGMILGSWVLIYVRQYLFRKRQQQKSLLWNQKLLQVEHAVIWLPGIGLLLQLFPYTRSSGNWFLENAINISLTIMVFLAISKILDAIVKISEASERFKTIPIRVFVQLVYILLVVLFLLLIVADWFNQPLTNVLAGFGAGSAILMLMFKDSIMGFTAGIQLAANKMVALGDWIEMPKYGADGDVIEVSLYTVKVRNWDKTITLIPTYALISDSFKNWRGMFESGGRRIKRTVYIDMNSIKFCNQEMLDRFAKIPFVDQYIQEKLQELAEYNRQIQVIDNRILTQEKWLTNVGIFRAYVVSYLKAHPQISPVHTFLVRHLQPTEHGLPIQIYVFSSDTIWVNYENIQADIFDHILSVIPEFELRVFQNPSGYDFQKLR